MEAVILLACANCGDQAHDCLSGTVLNYDWVILLLQSSSPSLPLANFPPTTLVSSKVNIYSFPIGPDFYGFDIFGISDNIAQIISARVNNSHKLVPLSGCYMVFVSAVSHDVVMPVYPQDYLCLYIAHFDVRVLWQCHVLNLLVQLCIQGGLFICIPQHFQWPGFGESAQQQCCLL